MKRKSVKWDEGLLAQLKDPKFAMHYVEGALEEGLPLHVALGDVVRAQGVTRVAQRAHIAKPNVLRAIRPSSNPTYQTLRKILVSVGLEFSVRLASST